jgi:glycosyltransferase involved in cell wall biosynthesis
MPKVSFVIPVYDGDSYLSETIETARNQTMKDIEIIVVDDCSPDFTPDLMEYYTKLDDRIKYHRFEENKGVQEARNFGNTMATGDIICVLDQDDLCKPWRAGFSYYYFQNHPEIDCLTSSYWECNVDGVQTQLFNNIPNMTRDLFEEGHFVWMHSSCAYRKEDALKIPYRVMDGATDDWAFLDDWTKAGKKFKTVRPVLANCRRLPWGVMSQRRQSANMSQNYIL